MGVRKVYSAISVVNELKFEFLNNMCPFIYITNRIELKNHKSSETCDIKSLFQNKHVAFPYEIITLLLAHLYVLTLPLI